jgi:hypothetical protein
MNPRPAPPLAPLLSVSLAFATAVAQDPVRFVTKPPVIHLALHDLPALLEALPGTEFGKLFAQPDVAEALALGQSNYAKKIARHARLVAAMARRDPKAEQPVSRLERAFYELDWRDWRSGTLSMILSDTDARSPVTAMLLEPRPAAEGRLAQRLETLRTELLATVAGQTDLKLADEQKVDSHPATVVVNASDEGQGMADDFWMLHLPGQFAFGTGAAAQAGSCKPARAAAPGVALEVDIPAYLSFIQQFTGDQGLGPVMQALGVDQIGVFAWRLFPAGELLQDELSLEMKGPAGGMLGALLEGMAPLPDQPLPEGALLQLRCAFDVALLARAVDQLLEANQLPTLEGLGLVEDLRKAWSGGMSLAVARPATGSFIPRLYASFGIVDQPALDRLLERLRAHPGLETKAVTYEGTPSVQLRLEGLPTGIQPSYCVKDGTIHFAECGLSLRALLKSAGPPNLDVGKAPRPAGPGALLPAFEVRFDGAAIHQAVHEVWMPLATTASFFENDAKPLVPLAEMPGCDVVVPHLRKGRGVLRRSDDRLVLSMSGTAGGPELHALLAAYGPFLSNEMTNSWEWSSENLTYELAKLQVTQVHAAIAAFEKRAGKRPASLGELLAAGDLKDASLLLVEGDDVAEPVVHEGKELGKSSFRYFPAGVKLTPEDQEVTALLVSVKATLWRRLVVDLEGTVHEGYGTFATTKLEELLKQR